MKVVMVDIDKSLRKRSSDYLALFNNAPLSIWETDWSDVKEFIDKLRFGGVKDFDHHFNDHIEDVIKCSSLIKVIKVNKATLDLFKAKNKKDFERGLSKIFTEDSLKSFKNELVAFADGELVFEDENNCIDLEGAPLTVNVKTIFLETDSKPCSRLLCVEDITWKKEFQRSRDESVRNYEQVLQTADEGIGIINTDSQFTYVNQKLTEITGYSADEMIEMSFFDLFEKAKEDEIKEHIRRRYSGISEKYEIEGVRKDGTKGWVLISASPIFDEVGQINATLGMVTDITERKMAEQALKEREEKLIESEQLYRMLSENSDNVIAIIDKKLDISYINKRGSKRLGKSVDEIVGMNVSELYDKKTLSIVKKSVGKALRSKRSFEYKLETDVNGTKRWLEIHILPIINNDGKITSFIASSHDITELSEEKIFSEALNEINSLVNSILDFKDIFKSVMPKATEVLGTESSAFFERSKGAWILKYHRQSDSSKLPVGLIFTDNELPIAHIAASTKAAFAIEDASQGEQLRREAMEKLGVRSALMIPLTRRNKIIGVICFCNHTKTQIFTEKQLDFSNKLAALLSLSFENASLYRKEREEKMLSLALNDINSVIHLEHDLDKALESIMQKASDAFGCDFCVCNLREDDHWIVRHIFGLPKDMVGMKFSDNEAPGSVITHKTKKASIVDDAMNDERVNTEIIKKYGIRSIMTAPLFVRDSMIGVLALGKRSSITRFSKTQIDYLNKVAASISFAFESARLKDKQYLK